MMYTIKQCLKELIIILAMMQVVILMLRVIIPVPVKMVTRALKRIIGNAFKFTFKELRKGVKILLAYYNKMKEPTLIEQAPNVIPFPSLKKVAK